ncbi:MAG: hypothetical protein EOO01_38010 [Chitinophagaceae bacterium]|nr:MAG: hypothetical protein EOO01_38010 [Chitinophagaceae bacterium]
MKHKFSSALALALLVTIFYSCKNTNSPQAVTEKFLSSFVKMDLETAKSLSTKNTWGLLDIWASFSKDVPEAMRQEKAANFKVKITETRKESDSTMIITYTSEPKILPFNKLRLLRQVDQEGRERWKVDISTLDLVGGDEMYIEEENKAVEVEVERGAPDTVVNKED